MEILKLKTKISEIKYSLKGLQRIELAEVRISDLEDRLIEIMEAEEQREKCMKRNEQNFQDVGHHQMCQHTSNGNIRTRGEKREEKNSKNND